MSTIESQTCSVKVQSKSRVNGATELQAAQPHLDELYMSNLFILDAAV